MQEREHVHCVAEKKKKTSRGKKNILKLLSPLTKPSIDIISVYLE